jgi:F-type H+-transporting ATPase subunit gamma
MKMVSAAKLRKTQDVIVKMRPYVNKLQEIMAEVTSTIQDEVDISYIKSRPVHKVLIVLVTSNKGLCGAFNSNLTKQALQYATETYPDLFSNGNVHFYCAGNKGYDLLKTKNVPVFHHENAIIDALTYEKATDFAEQLMKFFNTHEYDKIEFFYNRFKNAAVQIITNEPFLPVVQNIIQTKPEKYQKNYIFEPGQIDILNEILPLSLKSQVYKILLDSITAEHGARMTAMHKATESASEMLYDLRLTYNKARQASITNEILEIVSGANALHG